MGKDEGRTFICLLLSVSYFPLVKGDPLGDWLPHTSRLIYPMAFQPLRVTDLGPHSVVFLISPDVMGQTKSSARWRA